MIKTLLCIGAGSFLGGVSRYLTGQGMKKLLHQAVMPWGTFAVNVVGCFLIGFFYGLSEKATTHPSGNLMAFLTVGFCGGFTTFSTFVNESGNFLAQGDIVRFMAYPLGSFAIGLLALFCGRMLARAI